MQSTAITYVAPARIGETLTAEVAEVHPAGRSGMYHVAVRPDGGRLVVQFRSHSRSARGQILDDWHSGFPAVIVHHGAVGNDPMDEQARAFGAVHLRQEQIDILLPDFQSLDHRQPGHVPVLEIFEHVADHDRLKVAVAIDHGNAAVRLGRRLQGDGPRVAVVTLSYLIS